MRIEIKTEKRVTDRDIRALYLIAHAIEQSTPRMKNHNLAFIADREGYELVPKQKEERP